jgi:hypothetical protein
MHTYFTCIYDWKWLLKSTFSISTNFSRLFDLCVPAISCFWVAFRKREIFQSKKKSVNFNFQEFNHLLKGMHSLVGRNTTIYKIYYHR